MRLKRKGRQKHGWKRERLEERDKRGETHMTTEDDATWRTQARTQRRCRHMYAKLGGRVGLWFFPFHISHNLRIGL